MAYSTQEKLELDQFVRGPIDDTMLNAIKADALDLVADGDIDIELLKAVAAQVRGYPMGLLETINSLT